MNSRRHKKQKNKKKKKKEKSLLKVLEDIISEAIFCSDDDLNEGIDSEMLATCFVEEISSIVNGVMSDNNDNYNDEWKSIMENILQDTGGYSSDVINEVINNNNLNNQFIQNLINEINNENKNEMDHLYEGMIVQVMENVTNTWMDGRILKLNVENDDECMDNNNMENGKQQILILITKYNKKQYCNLSEISTVSNENLWEDAGEEGECQLCFRSIPLTLHHLIPKTVHSHFLSKRKKQTRINDNDSNDSEPSIYTREVLNRCINVCRPCHSAIHKAEDELTLAEKYNTLEKIQNHKDIIKFTSYISKQKNTKHNSDDRVKPINSRKQQRRKKKKRKN